MTQDNYEEPGFDNTTFGKIVLAVLFVAALCSLAMAFSGCRSEKWATRKLAQVQTYQPGVFAGRCADAFPIKESSTTNTVYKEGSTVYRVDTVTVNCDSLLRWSNATTLKYVKLPCPPCPVRVDTIFKTSTIVQENTARITALSASLSKSEGEVTAAQAGRNAWRKWALISWTLIVAGAILAAVKLYLKSRIV